MSCEYQITLAAGSTSFISLLESFNFLFDFLGVEALADLPFTDPIP